MALTVMGLWACHAFSLAMRAMGHVPLARMLYVPVGRLFTGEVGHVPPSGAWLGLPVMAGMVATVFSPFHG